MDISVVIPARNAERTIAQQLRALRDQDYDGAFEVIVADNQSTDATSAIVDDMRRNGMSNLRTVEAHERAGINHPRNVGARAARADLVAFCDADDVAAPGWLTAIADGLGDFDAAGGVIETDRLNGPSFAKLMHNPAGRGVDVVMDFLPRPHGGNCGLRKAVFEELGGFDEDFAGGGDETEFFWRLQLAGFTLGTVEGAVMSCRLRSSSWGVFKQLFGFASARPQLYRKFRDAGLSRAGVREVLSRWWWVASRTPLIVMSADGRARWLRRTATALGYLSGSIRHRVLYL